MRMEEWKDIEGWEELYQVSDKGNVRSLDRWTRTKGNSMRLRKGRMLKQFLNNCGYFQVSLVKNGKQKWYKVHRLVANAFLPNPDNLPVCNHKDENPLNNNVDNLEFCTQKYNVNYGTSQLRRAETISKPVYQYTLDNQLVKVWKSTKECGRNGFKGAWHCCSGRSKTCKGFRWSYTPLEAPND